MFARIAVALLAFVAAAQAGAVPAYGVAAPVYGPALLGPAGYGHGYGHPVAGPAYGYAKIAPAPVVASSYTTVTKSVAAPYAKVAVAAPAYGPAIVAAPAYGHGYGYGHPVAAPLGAYGHGYGKLY